MVPTANSLFNYLDMGQILFYELQIFVQLDTLDLNWVLSIPYNIGN